MYRIAICDDEQDVCGNLESVILSCEERLNLKPMIEVFYSGQALLEYMNKGNMYDVIFLDIEMESLNGIELGKLLRENKKDNDTKIVYISWNKGHAMDLFKIRPYDFLVKPLKNRIQEIKKIVYDIYDEIVNDHSFFCFKVGKNLQKLQNKDIVYFESSNRVVNIYTANDNIRFYDKLDNVESSISGSDFLRIHKSILINVKHVEKFKSQKVYMDNGKELTISQTYKNEVNNFIMEHWGKL